MTFLERNEDCVVGEPINNDPQVRESDAGNRALGLRQIHKVYGVVRKWPFWDWYEVEDAC